MKQILWTSLIFTCLILQGCRPNNTCEKLLLKKLVSDRIEEISVEKIWDGHNMAIESRFKFSCIYYNGKEISLDVNAERKNDDLFSIKILTPDKYRLRNNDTVKVFFTDDRKIIWEISALKLVSLVIKKEVTPCDSVFNIIYKDISEKIDDIVTNEKIEIKQLYDLTLKNKIKQYISTLSLSNSLKFNECQKKFFILDLVNNDDKFGFEENKYFLTPKLKDYLNTIAESISFEVRRHEWSKSQFIIKCIGYADRNRYTGSPNINFSDLGITDSAQTLISNTNCGFDGGAFEVLGNRSTNYSKLKNVLNNCHLSVLRSYVTVNYLKKRLGELTNSKFIFQYKGGGEIPDNKFEFNRKIDLNIEIKGVSDKN